ncbi:MAG: DUF3857 domain-containing protein [Myxococcota bacterium]|jgi:transglutaminase-like putative cysteine protease|nr:DUF3857 domain-containing protein [Myxococcota bacterium]
MYTPAQHIRNAPQPLEARRPWHAPSGLASQRVSATWLRVLAMLAALLTPFTASAENLGNQAKCPIDKSSMEASRLDALAESMRQAEPPILAYPIFLSLDGFQERLSAPQLEAWLEALDSDPLHPLVRLAIAKKRCDLLLQSQGQAADCYDALGYLSRGHIIGPFPNDGGAGFDSAYPPEDFIDLELPVDGRFDGLRWLPYSSSAARISFIDNISPSHDAVVYFATIVESPRARSALLWLAADGAYSAWLNGQLLGTRSEDLGAVLDRDPYQLELQSGHNLLLVKVASGSHSASLLARLSELDGSPLLLPHGIQRPESAIALNNDESLLRPADSVHDQLALCTTADCSFWNAYLLHRLCPNDASESASSALLEALELGANGPLQSLLALDIVQEDWRRQLILDTAIEAAPNDPWLRAAKLEQWLRGSSYERADELKQGLDALLGSHASSLTPALLRFQQLYSDGLYWAAQDLAQKLDQEHPCVPAVLQALHDAALALDEPEAQRQAARALLEIDQRAEHWRLRLVRSELRRGATDDALALLEQGLLLLPHSWALRESQLDLLELLDRKQELHNALELAILTCPTCVQWHQRRAEMALENGEQEEALDALRLVSSLELHNQTVRQLLRYLDPESESFEQPFLIHEVSNVPAAGYPDDYLVLLDQKITLLHPNGLSSTFVQTVYQPLTEAGVASLRHLPVYYTPDDELLEIEMMRVLRADGSQFDTYDRYEQSVSDESIRMYYDYRQVVLSLPELAVGDRVELRYRKSQVAQSNFLEQQFGDVWYMQDLVPKLHQRYVLIAPAQRELVLRLPESFQTAAQNGLASYQESEIDNRRIYQVERFDAPRIVTERMMPGWGEVADYLLVSTFSTWSEVARVYWNLAKEQWIVDKDIRDTVQKLIEGISDRRERVRRIHNYVVKNTRYVALEFGIHGYKPYRTTVSFRRRFGDCKDKASLMKVMLEEAGIPAHIVLIRTNQSGRIATEPPSLSIFDHAIAYVPEFDLFLDGTAEFSGTSELPSMDEGAQLLIVKENGEFELRDAPVSSAEDNLMSNDYRFDLRVDGAQLRGSAKIQGLFAAGYRQRLESLEKRNDAFEREIASDFPGASLVEVSFSNVDDLEEPVAFDFVAELPSLLVRSGNAYLLTPLAKNSMLTQALAPSASREHELMLPFSLGFDDTIVFELPDELQLEELPSSEQLVSDFGKLSLNFDAQDRRIEVRASLRLERRRVAAAEYKDFQRFIMSVDRAINHPIRLIAKEASR